jgi:hypothetical protein
MKTKPSIVFAHGLWADGSCFSKLISTLQAQIEFLYWTVWVSRFLYYENVSLGTQISDARDRFIAYS